MMAKKRVLMLSTLEIQPLVPVRGTPVVAYTVQAYLEHGWEIHFLISFKPKPDAGIAKRLKISWFSIPLLSKLNNLPKIGFFTRIIWWIITQVMFFVKGVRILKNCKIDLIYSWDVNAASGAKILAKMFRKPWIARCLGTSLQTHKLDKLFYRVRNWNQIFAYKLFSDFIIMTNDGTQGNKVLQKLGVEMSKVLFWMNGVDWNAFYCLPQSTQAKKSLGINNRPVLLCVSRLVKWKRVDRSISALPVVANSYPNVLLLIVGDGPEREQLEQLAKDLGVQDNVRFEGAVPHSEIPKYLAAADIFLSFYDWSNVGNPLLEAMMAGKCIITLNNGDTGKFVKNWENGVLLDYKDLPKLPEVIKRLLIDEKLREGLGAKARKFAEKNFWSWEERLDAEIKEVKKLLRQ